MFLVRRFRFASVLIIAENACYICRGNGVNEELLISKRTLTNANTLMYVCVLHVLLYVEHYCLLLQEARLMESSGL